MTAAPIPVPDITVDGTGQLCITLLLRLVARVKDAQPGTVVHVIATDPAGPLDLPAWCRMTGHTYLGPVAEPDDTPAVYALRLAADARPTIPHTVQAGRLTARRDSLGIGKDAASDQPNHRRSVWVKLYMADLATRYYPHVLEPVRGLDEQLPLVPHLVAGVETVDDVAAEVVHGRSYEAVVRAPLIVKPEAQLRPGIGSVAPETSQSSAQPMM
ncbi:sulfurtransferase TusA family protein [Streptomyces sp. NPDC058220]|uniref:sulfurtransferase TusA family protein n=1 Tax=Streptomyces sp. NPDC058220 TaxID=3346387 RepID=UPI0036E569DE